MQKLFRSNSKDIRIQIIATSILLSVIISTILAIFSTRAITQPIEALTDIAHQVVEENNFNVQIPVISTDEVGVLAVSFNQMIQCVSHYIEELEQARQILELRVQERTEELAHKNQQLQQASQVLEMRVQERTEELAHRNYELQQAHDQLNQTLQSLKSSQSQLIQSEKMSSLGQMVSGIAHEVNNPINFISGNLEYTQQYVEKLLNLINLYQQQEHQPTDIIESYKDQIDLEFILNDLPSILTSMKIGVERIRNLVLSLRNFYRLDESEVKAVDIHEGIDSTLLILSHRIKMGITITKQYHELPLIECYPAQLNQVFMNIISNAIDELFSSHQTTAGEIVIQTQVLTDKEINVIIRDNGRGIPQEIIQKIFDPFFTTKPVGQGTGLGLAISYQIIEKHQGKIQVNSGQGTEFVITLPIRLFHSQKLLS